MRSLKRFLYYLIINIFVSACTTLAVLTYWERTHPAGIPGLDVLSRGRTETPQAVDTADQLQTSQLEPEPIPSATSRPLMTYTVRPGDTLGAIAIEFGTTIEDLIEINRLDDPSALGSGQVLFVPGQPPTDTGLPGEADVEGPEENQPAGELPAATETPVPGGLVVIANVFGVGDLATERVRLERRGDGDVSMSGWQLRDAEGQVYTFPQLTLYPGGAVDVHSGPGVNGVVALYWGLSEAVWSTGEIVTLFDQTGNRQAVFQVP